MKKILVTGATGFVGNYVIARLLQLNDYSISASSTSIDKATNAPWFPAVKYIPFNFKDFDLNIDYYKFFGEPDLVIHLAWQGLPNYKAAFHVEENLPLHFSLLKNLVDHGLADLTVTGTCFEYGLQEGILSEEMEINPSNAYAIAKDSLRKQLEQLQMEKEFQLKWIRLFYMYGSGQSSNALLSQLDKAIATGETVFNMSGGEQERDYLPVYEVATNIVAIALQKRVTGIINCCSGKPIKVKALVENYLAKRNMHIQLNLGFYPYADYEAMRFWGDDKKLKKIADYE